MEISHLNSHFQTEGISQRSSSKQTIHNDNARFEIIAWFNDFYLCKFTKKIDKNIDQFKYFNFIDKGSRV